MSTDVPAAGLRGTRSRPGLPGDLSLLAAEIDHCAGLRFLDRVAGAHAVYARQTYL